MFKFLRIAILAFMLPGLLMAAVSLAQNTPPSQIDQALADLSAQVGTEVTLGDLDEWSWSEQVYGDTSLGCPQPDQVYAQVTTRGYQFLMTYSGVQYDYRVASDGSAVILCSATGAVQPTTAPAQPVTTPVNAAECPDLPLQLTIGETGRAIGNLNSNLRAEPSAESADIGDIQPGGVFTVIGGPVCDGEFWWWQVQTGTLTGWVAQGQDGLYYIAPVPQPLPDRSLLADLNPATIGQIAPLTTIQENLRADVVWSSDGNTMAVVSANVVNTGIWLYDVNNLSGAAPAFLTTPALVTAMAYTPDGTMLVTGDVDGNVIFWDILNRTDLFTFQAHEGDVLDMAFSPDGLILTTLGENGNATLWGVPR